MSGMFSRFYIAFQLAVPLLAGASLDRVVEDTPGRLSLEVTVPAAALRTSASPYGSKVLCTGCQTVGLPGAPDLPVYHFEVIAGSGVPQVSMHILESETRPVPQGIAPFPKALSPTRSEFRPDSRLYQEAAALLPRLGGLRYLRGVPVRSITVPLALWSEGDKTLTLIRRLRVEVTFPGVLPKPAANRLQAPFSAAVRNPVGGAYLYASRILRPSRTLRKTAAAGGSARPRETFLKIKVGDKHLENLDEDRVYAVSFGDLIAAGANMVAINVGSLRMFTGPHDTLPQAMDTLAAMAGTLKEIPIEVLDKNKNGTFDEGDSLRFFAHGTSLWKRIAGTLGPIRYEFSSDPYSFETYYYLDYSQPPVPSGLRLVAQGAMAPVSPARTVSYAYLRAELDRETGSCDLNSHRDDEAGMAWYWYWNGACGSADNTLTLTNRQIVTSEVEVLKDLAQGANDSLFLGFNGLRPSVEDYYSPYFGGQSLPFFRDHAAQASYYVQKGTWSGAPAFRLDSLAWKGGGRRFEGYTVVYKRKHVFSGAPVWIFPEVRGKRVSYHVEGGAGLSGLRVDSGVATRLFTLDDRGEFTDSLGAASDARYLVYREGVPLPAGSLSTESLPAAGSAIANLLDTLEYGIAPEYVIITPRVLLPAALALRDYRNNPSRVFKVKTAVVVVEDIYREFSSGRRTPVGIRDFLRYAYAIWGGRVAGSNPLKYALLFGDGHYDYREIRASAMNGDAPPNLIPPFEMYSVQGEVLATDDFFGFLDGSDNLVNTSALDIAVGRIPVQSLDQAMAFINKIKEYEEPSKSGEWRNRVVLTADDATQRNGDNNLDPITAGHTNDTERLGFIMQGNEPGIDLNKVYLLDYPMNGAFQKPQAAQDLLSLINRGSLVVNYVGHGSENQWADEVLLQTNDALTRMSNSGKYAMINAFSCTVGRFEKLTAEGMSEQLVKLKGAGAIAAVSATRESYPSPNLELARAFYSLVFPPDTVLGAAVTVGDALRQAKGASPMDRVNNLKYTLLGEPVLLLRKPQLGITFTQAPDTLRALDCNSIKGRIQGGSGRGSVNLRILAGSTKIIYNPPYPMDPQSQEKRGNILFEQTFTYENGEFSTKYFIPKQISFGDTNAQILAFAWDAEEEREGSVGIRNLSIQGTAKGECAENADKKGPRITITGCEEKETAGLDFPDRVKLALPYCLQIQVEDSVGGVLSASGPDEGTTLEIPGSLPPFHPQPGLDELYKKSYRLTLNKGEIRPGSHVLKVSAQDGYGNIGTRQLRLDLTMDSSLVTLSAFNVPNPMKRSGTRFWFNSVLPEKDVEVGGDPNFKRVAFEVRIFNQMGNLVKVFRDAQPGVAWDGRDEWGNRLANGVYFYTVISRQSLADPGPVAYRTLSSKRNTLIISR